jgi:microcystin-dependent protein
MEFYVGQIFLFGGNFAPRDSALCQGQLLSISSYSSLFSILGTTYGGDGRSTFGLPDLRGRAPLSEGTGGGLSRRSLGESGGAETHSLTTSQIASHSHNLLASTSEVNQSTANSNALGAGAGFPPSNLYTDQSPTDALNSASVAYAGSSGSHNNMPPYLTLNWCIALNGIYPSRN